MNDKILSKSNSLSYKLQRLMLIRVAIVTFLLGTAALIQFHEAFPLQNTITSCVYLIIIVTYLLSLIYVILLKFIVKKEIHVYIQVFFDIVLITTLVYITGGIRSIYSVLYPLVIIYATLLLSKQGGLIAASASSILYGLIIVLEYYHIIAPVRIFLWEYDFSSGYVLSRIFIHIVSFYIVVFLISIAVDQEKKARSLLEKQQDEFKQLDLLHKSIIESADLGIITIDLNQKIKSANRAATEILKMPFKNIENIKIDNIISGLNINCKDNINKKEIIYTINGKERILGISFSDLMDSLNNKIGNLLLFNDLTFAKKMEKEIEKSKRLAFIGEMAAGLAHEIRNPLASLSGSIQILNKRLMLDETNQRLMNIIMRGRKQLENIVQDFLLLARPDLGERQQININEIICEVIESIKYSDEWNDSIIIETKLGQLMEIACNITEIRQMIWNLISNSIHAMPESGILTIETDMIHNINHRNFVKISIQDNGTGIKESDLDKILNPFYTTRDGGTGLGLAIVNRIVESHKGFINIKSKWKEGTCFTILLPSL